jgi:hypothetical protein
MSDGAFAGRLVPPLDLFDVRFSNRPFEVKRFQTIHQDSSAKSPTASRPPKQARPYLQKSLNGAALNCV